MYYFFFGQTHVDPHSVDGYIMLHLFQSDISDFSSGAKQIVVGKMFILLFWVTDLGAFLIQPASKCD